MTLGEMAAEANQVATSKGWHLRERSFGDLVALMHSELSEALEEHRLGRRAQFIYAGDKVYEYNNEDLQTLETLAGNGVAPEGVGIELADVLIRILDYAHDAGIDLDAAVRIKTEYNRTRPYRHGKIM